MRSRLVRSRITVPELAPTVHRRERVAELLTALISTYRLVSVSATAGAGKTTAVVHAAERVDRKVAWIGVDSTDAPGGLLRYLEAALSEHVSAVDGITTSALRHGISHSETAGLLVEATAGEELLLVIDDLERIRGHQDVLHVIAALVRYAPQSLRIVLISRADAILDLREKLGPERAAEVGERDLAFTEEEAGEALMLAGRGGIDPREAIAATGGWVTGVLFEAWRAEGHVPGAGGETDPLHGYLATQILDDLEPGEAGFLVATSLLEVVTPGRAGALGVRRPRQTLASLRRRRLPVTWSPDGLSMRAHPRFREYLLHQLAGDPDEAQRRRRFATLLANEGHHQEAVEESLRAGALGQAAADAGVAIGGVIERLDFNIAERWLRALAPVGARGVSLASAELMVAMGRERYVRAAEVGDELTRLSVEGGRQPLADAGLEGLVAWAYWHTGRVDDARRLLEGSSDREVDVFRGMAALSDDGAPPPLLDLLAPTSGPTKGLLMRTYYMRGYLQTLVAAEPDSPWGRAMGAAVRVGTLCATGRTAQALALFEEARQHDQPGAVWLHALAAVELMIELDRRDKAWETLNEGQRLIGATGSQPYALLSHLLEARLHLKFGRDVSAALGVLAALEPRTSNYAFIRERVDTLSGLALLLGGGSREPQLRLRRAVASMVQGDRFLELPAAAIYLAEAEWRCGDEDAADAAADVALSAASRHGSNHMLLQALAEFPTVGSRRLDAEPTRDTPWRELVRVGTHHTASIGKSLAARVTLQDLGTAGLVVDGVERRPRILKSIELLGFLEAQPRGGATRDDILDALFGGYANRSYLRQALFRLREVLPPEIAPRSEGHEVLLPMPEVVTSNAAAVEALLEQGARLQGEAMLAMIGGALELAEEGPYLADSNSPWVEDRRQRLRDQLGKARFSAATVAFHHGRYPDAERLLDAFLRENPFSEEAWRLGMAIAEIVGDADKLLQLYLRCERSLREVGLNPSNETVEQFNRLRRALVGHAGRDV